MNISATLNIFRLFRDPALCLPHATISNFNYLPVPLSTAFYQGEKGTRPDIRAVVLDKDNCFARPGENEVYRSYTVSVISPINKLALSIYYKYFAYLPSS